MGLNYFMIEETSSLDYGVVISKAAVFDAPERAYEEVSVPGRNGSVLFDEGYYRNITVRYEASMKNKDANLDSFRAWLLSFTKYVRLEDTYHPEEYRLGIPSGGISVDMSARLSVGSFTVSFNCKPQRYLKTGEIGTRYEESFQLFNPTYYPAKPLIRVYGYGQIGIGNETITITSHALEYIDLDCDLQDAFCGSANANGYVSLSGDQYPEIPGNATTGIVLPATVSAIVLTPRWWTL